MLLLLQLACVRVPDGKVDGDTTDTAAPDTDTDTDTAAPDTDTDTDADTGDTVPPDDSADTDVLDTDTAPADDTADPADTAAPDTGGGMLDEPVDAAAQAVLYGGAGEGAGFSVAGAGDLDGDGYPDVLVGGYYGRAAPGKAWFVRGPLVGTRLLADADATYTAGQESAYAALRVAAAGDVDGDGVGDVVIGSPQDGLPSGDRQEGAVYVFHGPLSGAVDAASAATTWAAGAADASLGQGVWGGADLDGDGLSDLVVGAYESSPSGREYAGAAYVLPGATTGLASVTDAVATFTGEIITGYAGYDVRAADLDGDGASDLMIGSSGSWRGAVFGGAVYVVYGPVAGTRSLADADAALVGDVARAYAGRFDTPGDLDGDGLDDVLLGAYAIDGTGGAYVFCGAPTADRELSSADAAFPGEQDGSEHGYGVAGPGDLDGDGWRDVAVGAPSHDGPGGADAGAVWLYTGPFAGTYATSDATRRWTGAVAGDSVGWSLAGAGDTDGDGLLELLIGTPHEGTEGVDAGAVWAVGG